MSDKLQSFIEIIGLAPPNTRPRPNGISTEPAVIIDRRNRNLIIKRLKNSLISFSQLFNGSVVNDDKRQKVTSNDTTGERLKLKASSELQEEEEAEERSVYSWSKK